MPHPRLGKKNLYKKNKKYLFSMQSNANGSFLEKYIIFVEQTLKFSHFECSKISK